MMSCRKIPGVFALIALVYAPVVAANEGDVLNLSANVTTMHDSNLFRLAPSVSPTSVGLEGRSDTITATTLSLNVNKQISLQQLIANVSLVDTRYQRNDYLDFRALNYDAKWLWAVGLRWTGELAVDRSESLNSFTDYNNFHVRNVRTIHNERFTANYWFHSNWAVLAGVTRNTLINEQTFLADSDYEMTGFNYGIRYRPVSGNTLTLRAKQLSGTYSNREFNIPQQYDDGFEQKGYELNVDWQLTGKAQLQGRLEYLERQHDHFASRDYDGWAANINLAYAPTGKVVTNFGYKRDLQAFQRGLLSSYYVLDEVNLSAKWAATHTLTATARLGYGLRSYRGEIVALPAGQREDKYTRAGLDVAYMPVRWLELKAGINLENRNVNSSALDYRDRMGFLSLTAHY